MGASLDFCLISNIDFSKDYSKFEGLNYIEKGSLCVKIDDDTADEFLSLVPDLPVYQNKFGNITKGMESFGISLIPPDSQKELLSALKKSPQSGQIRRLIRLLKLAMANDKYVICYGV